MEASSTSVALEFYLRVADRLAQPIFAGFKNDLRSLDSFLYVLKRIAPEKVDVLLDEWSIEVRLPFRLFLVQATSCCKLWSSASFLLCFLSADIHFVSSVTRVSSSPGQISSNFSFA